MEDLFIAEFERVQQSVHETAKDKGWWDAPRPDAELIALMHSELSEALEALRMGNMPSEKIEGFDCVEEELADVVIRIMDMAAARGYRVAAAVLAKAEKNKARPKRHGGKRF